MRTRSCSEQRRGGVPVAAERTVPSGGAPRSDADTQRMVADKNRQEFKGDHLVAIETVGPQ